MLLRNGHLAGWPGEGYWHFQNGWPSCCRVQLLVCEEGMSDCSACLDEKAGKLESLSAELSVDTTCPESNLKVFRVGVVCGVLVLLLSSCPLVTLRLSPFKPTCIEPVAWLNVAGSRKQKQKQKPLRGLAF